MSRFDIGLLSNTLVSLILNIGLVVGLYFIFTFTKKVIRQGKFDMKLWEIFLGVFLVAVVLYLKFVIFFE